MSPAEAATVAAVRAYCDVLAALPCDPERASRWCREHSDGTARGLLEAARGLVDGLPWDLVRPEGPVDLRAWGRIAAATPEEIEYSSAAWIAREQAYQRELSEALAIVVSCDDDAARKRRALADAARRANEERDRAACEPVGARPARVVRPGAVDDGERLAAK